MSERNDTNRRQVIPDVDEGHEYFGQSAFGLIQIYTPALGVWFVGINLMPPGWTWLSAILGTLLFIGATVAILAAPSHETPGEYVHSIWIAHTQQGVHLHE